MRSDGERYRILYEDRDVLVVYKVAGVAVQSARVTVPDVMSMLEGELVKREGRRPYLGLANRLDQPVEGIFLVGRSARAAAELSRQVGAHEEMEKWYQAVVWGRMPEKRGKLVDDLLKDGRRNVSLVVPKGTRGAKRCELFYEVLKEEEGKSLLRIRLLTGRHHQIRVQLSHAGVPIVGDKKYGREDRAGRLCLCACEVAFVHPGNGERMCFRVEPSFLEGWTKLD